MAHTRAFKVTFIPAATEGEGLDPGVYFRSEVRVLHPEVDLWTHDESMVIFEVEGGASDGSGDDGLRFAAPLSRIVSIESVAVVPLAPSQEWIEDTTRP